MTSDQKKATLTQRQNESSKGQQKTTTTKKWGVAERKDESIIRMP